MQDTLGEVFHVVICVRDSAPEEHAHLVLVVFATQHIHDLLGILAATGIGLDVCHAMPLVGVVVGLGSSQLDASESTALDVRLHLQDPGDELGIGGAEAHTPAWHVVALRHRIELDAAVLGARHLQKRERLVVEDEAVGIVVHHDDVVVLCEPHQTLVGLHAGRSACRHVGIVGPHQPYTRKVHLLQLVEIGLPAVLRTQVVVHNLRAENLAERGIGGIARIGHQHLVARIDESQRDMQDAFLRAYQRQHLLRGVEIYIVKTLVEACHSLTQLRRAHRWLIAVGIGLAGHLAQLFYGLLRRRHVGAADSQAYDVFALGIKLSHLLQLPAEVIFTH